MQGVQGFGGFSATGKQEFALDPLGQRVVSSTYLVI